MTHPQEEIMFTDKRKNDDKAKRHPVRRWTRLFMAAVVVMILTASATLWLMFRPAPVLYPQFPATPLFYLSDSMPYILNLQTGERHPPSGVPVVSYLTASKTAPDGSHFASWNPHAPDWELTIQTNPPTDTNVPVFRGGIFAGPVTSPTWSADSNNIAFSASYEIDQPEACPCDEEIFIVSAHSLVLRRLTDNSVRDANPSFSPDGTQIVYTSAPEQVNHLYIMDLNTGASRLLTSLPADKPIWSPDGQWIAFITTSLDSNGDIWLIRPDGTDAQAVTMGIARDDSLVWVR
jgi:hypothetical protein